MWVPFLQPAATLVLAFAAYSIGRQQQKTNSDRLRHELYERRFEVYELLQDAIFKTQSDDEDWKIGDELCAEALRKSEFVCSGETKFILNVSDTIVKYIILIDRIDKAESEGDTEKRIELEEDFHVVADRLFLMPDEATRRFKKYLLIE